MKIGEITDHRSREGGAIVYPVYSRRSGGLSIGINLFPDRKVCSFDCPYCEVFPFGTDMFFNLETMKAALSSAINEAKKNNIPVKDLCFSGNGEPTMSPFFIAAVNAAEVIRAELALNSKTETKLVVITNGAGLLNRKVFEFLKTVSLNPINLNIWLKLDAATEAWYRSINRSGVPHKELLSGIRNLAASTAPFTIQTMICKIKGVLPPQEENAAWVKLVTELAVLSAAAAGKNQPGQVQLKAVQLYGKTRPASEDPLAEAVSMEVLEERAAEIRLALKKEGIVLPVTVYR